MYNDLHKSYGINKPISFRSVYKDKKTKLR